MKQQGGYQATVVEIPHTWTAYTADPGSDLFRLLPLAAHSGPPNNPTGIVAKCDRKFTRCSRTLKQL